MEVYVNEVLIAPSMEGTWEGGREREGGKAYLGSNGSIC